MANTRKAAKRAKQANTRQARNTIVRGATRSALSKALTAVTQKDSKNAKELYQNAVKALSKAASTGAIAITSLQPMPNAHAPIAATIQLRLRNSDSDARITQYIVIRKNSPMSDSARWTMKVTDDVWSGCASQIAAIEHASGVAADPNRSRRMGVRNVRRATPNSASPASRCTRRFTK